MQTICENENWQHNSEGAWKGEEEGGRKKRFRAARSSPFNRKITLNVRNIVVVAFAVVLNVDKKWLKCINHFVSAVKMQMSIQGRRRGGETTRIRA